MTIPLAAIETESDGVRTPLTRVTGLSEKVMIRSETMPSELIERQTPFMSKVASPSRSLRQLMQSAEYRNIEEDFESKRICELRTR